jgi:hypothetical protein
MFVPMGAAKETLSYQSQTVETKQDRTDGQGTREKEEGKTEQQLFCESSKKTLDPLASASKTERKK